MDSYQAIFDAVRSNIRPCDSGEAIYRAIADANISFYFERVSNRALEIVSEYDRPSVVFKPKLSLDGNAWCALLGDNLQEGLAAFGDSPDEAMREFDKAWYEKESARVKAGEESGK